MDLSKGSTTASSSSSTLLESKIKCAVDLPGTVIPFNDQLPGHPGSREMEASRICRLKANAETIPNLTGYIKIMEGPLRAGGFCDVYKGELACKSGSEPVAMKLLRVFNNEKHVAKAKKKFKREVNLWRQLQHQHVLPFYGTCEMDECRLFMVSPWAERGNSLDYLQRNPLIDRGQLVWQISSALEYLHSGRDILQIVHGDLKADNVLVSAAGNALLCDFGLSCYVDDALSQTRGSSAGRAGGHPRFMAPELLLTPKDAPQNLMPTPESDTFAFGSLMLQMYTERMPFFDLSEIQAILKIINGALPQRPIEPIVLDRGLDDYMWTVITRCWQFQPSNRPKMKEITTQLSVRSVWPSETNAELSVSTRNPPASFSGASRNIHSEDANSAGHISAPALYRSLSEAHQILSLSRVPDSSLSAPLTDLGYPVFSRTSPFSLEGKIDLFGKHPVVSGGLSDIWKGFYGTVPVAIKVLRPLDIMGAHIEPNILFMHVWREFLRWSSLSHQNVLRCLGFSSDFFTWPDVPALISPWMSNGTVLEYIEKYPEADRLKLLLGIANGLSYLHDRNPVLVHGDIRARNVLVSDSGDAYIFDFGLARTLSDTGGMTTSSEVAGSLRWMSPELFQDYAVSTSSDVWAYGMTALEILTGNRPYHEVNEPLVLRHIIDGESPTRPQGVFHILNDNMWDICQRCWRSNPTDRPSMRMVARKVDAVLVLCEEDLPDEPPDRR